MKLLFWTYTCPGIIIMGIIFWRTANGQYYAQPNAYFQRFSFDMANRGSFNISSCRIELLNCMELAKPDILCVMDVYFDSICGIARTMCRDNGGYSDMKDLIMADFFCPNPYTDVLT